FGGPLRIAAGSDSPTRNERAVSNLHLLDRAFDSHAAAGDQKPVECQTAAGLAVDRQPLGPVFVLLVQIDDRPFAIRGTNLKALSAVESDVQRFGVDAVVGDLDDDVARRILGPLLDRLLDVA